MCPVRSWSRHSVPFRVQECTAQFLVKMPVEAEGDGVGRVQRQSALQPFVVAQLDRKGEKGLANPSISTIPEFRLDVSGRGCDVLDIEGMSTLFKDRRKSRPDVENPSQARPAPSDELLPECIGLSLVVAPFPGLPGHPSRWRRTLLLVIPLCACRQSLPDALEVLTGSVIGREDLDLESLTIAILDRETVFPRVRLHPRHSLSFRSSFRVKPRSRRARPRQSPGAPRPTDQTPAWGRSFGHAPLPEASRDAGMSACTSRWQFSTSLWFEQRSSRAPSLRRSLLHTPGREKLWSGTFA